MQRLHREYGALAGLVANSTVAFTFSPAYTRQLLADPDTYFSDPFIFGPPDSAHSRVTAGLLAMNQPTHRRHRRLMMPAFHRQQVALYHAAMADRTERHIATWAAGQTHDIAASMQQLTMQIAAQTLFGLDTSADSAALGRLIRRWLNLAESPLTMAYPLDKPGTPYRRMLAVAERIEHAMQAMLAQKRAAGAADNDVLSLLINARDEQGQPLSDTELIGHATVLFVAGHETTANALTWTLLLLSQHPQIAADLHDEVHSLLGGAVPTVEQLGQLPLLEWVIKESMRLLPPAVMSVRVPTRPVELGGHPLPRGSYLFFSPYITHRQPDVYDQPQVFRPQRWAMLDPAPYAYLPFGAGPRMCIGASFAMQEMKLVLAILLQRWGFVLARGTTVNRKVRVTMSPDRPLPLRLVPAGIPIPINRPRGTIRGMVDLPA